MLVENKENFNPNAYSSLLQSKLDEISFFSSDFEDHACDDRFKKLHDDIGAMLKKPNSRNQKKIAKKKTSPRKKKNRQPYDSVWVDRPGMTMFEMMRATDTPEKVVTFLQESGCLAKEIICPDCNNQMLLVKRKDKHQSKVFRCRKKNGDKKCQMSISITADSFFFNIHMSLFKAVWLL